MRIANSPAYMPRSPIMSLQHAVAMLGMSLLSEIAFTASIKAGTFQVSGHEPLVKNLWHHALASGAYAKEIARVRRFNVESAYLCGLLHCIGKPVVLRTLAGIGKQRGVTIEPAALQRLVGGHHSRVGGLIAEKWGLPQPVTEAIEFYQHYEQAPKCKRECALTYLADRFATNLLTPAEMEEAQLREDPVLADLNLYPDDVDALVGAKEKIRNLVEAMNL
jgi:putative nucleotidyltransferase with HDIG domain